MARRLLHYILSTESTAQSGPSDPKDAGKAAKPASKITQQPGETQKPSKPPEAPNGNTAKPNSPQTPVAPKVELLAAERHPPTAKQPLIALDHGSAKIITNALQIVSEESGIATEELVDDSVLCDIGIDSLLGLMISSRFRDELAVDIDSAILLGLATIGEMKNLLAPTQRGTVSENATEIAPILSLDGKEDNGSSNESLVASHTSDWIENKQESPSIPYLECDTKGASSNVEGLFSRVVQIISEETGLEINEFTDDTVFTDAGVDSLLSLMISSRLRDELDIEFSSDGELFSSCHTVGGLKTWLKSSVGTPEVDTPAENTPTHDTPGDSTPPDDTETEPFLAASSFSSSDSLASKGSDGAFKSDNYMSDTSSDEHYVEIPKPSIASRRATSIILQGRPWMSSKTLFLFPDGAGSASSYANLPKIHADIAIIGLNCPYVRHPQEMTCPLDELIERYLDEVKRRQPHGPYNFGGWSAGGILAYRATQILIQEGEEVENLVLIDSPEPKGLDRLPQRFYDHCNTIGVFGKAMPGLSTSPPAHLFAHFNATIEVLHAYHATPLPAGHLKKVLVIWATDSVMDGISLPKLPPGPDDTEGMKFLTEKRTDFTAHGWKTLVPGVVVDVERSQGAHHFSMMVSQALISLLYFLVSMLTSTCSSICHRLRRFLK